MTTRVVTMGPIDVECHNQLMGHLPTYSRSGGSSHAHIGSRYRLSSVLILEQQDGDGPPVWWGKCNSRFFWCHRVYLQEWRDLLQCLGLPTRTPHWHFLLENRDEKSSGSGSQKRVKLTYHVDAWTDYWWQLLRGAEQRHPTSMCSRAHKLRQHTGVGMG